MHEPASGRQALAARLGLLYTELRKRGKTRKAAVAEANRRRRRAAGRPEEVPWPRTKGGVDLSVQAVNDWFPKKKGPKEPSVPPDFEGLWSVVAVMLEWTGQLTDQRSAGRLRHDWHTLHKDAQSGNSLHGSVRAYLEAVRKAAEQHPHPGIAGRTDPPSLSEVYVRQLSSPVARDGHAASRRDDAPSEGGGSGLAAAAEPAEAVFHKADRVCVLIAGPGGGKSTLLRTQLRTAASAWLGTPKNARKNKAVPVWVSARTLAGEETQVPDALVAATRKLSRYGRHPELDKARFLQRPCTGAHWQLLVDDLDELPNANERRAVLEKLANAIADDPPLYRCVVATRPLTDNELDVLDRTVGHPAPRYELQPFTTDDLDTYTERYFGTRWPQDEATRRAQQFTGALRNASLDELARTPLMAFMLCQLYLAQPERPLPGGRTAVYEAFTDLVYENNQSRHIADSHEEAITRLVEGIQSPRARRDADEAARRVYDRLPDLIDYLAHQWLTSPQAPAATALASHEAVRRPAKVRSELWHAFLEDLLRHTGLLVHHADGLGFAHQTFLEYHAARHATRDEQTRARLLDELFPPGQKPRVPATERSYLGFLLDALLTLPGGFAAETTARIEALTRQGGASACQLLIEQVNLRTKLPNEPTARQLTRFAEDEALHSFTRVGAAEVLAGLEGYRDAGADRLIALADDPTLDDSERRWAAEVLAGLEGYRDAGADRLIALADDPTLDGRGRVGAAEVLAELEGYRDAGADRLIALANDPTLDGDRWWAAQVLAGLEGYRDAGADRLIALADDPTLDDSCRVEAAEVLAGLEGYQDAGADRLIALANDTTFDDSAHVRAAEALAAVELRNR
ncbi:NACHT domain-containing protein [Streptomyces longwoodensis]|uniref:NACHT domain-containing protein n=1 Tax=Streptomyces longwoodensis TaxID=68231 RepID=UPI003702C0B0